MKIYELVKKVNDKKSVKYSDVLEIKKYYLSMYRAYMVMMYDKGYISDPTGFNRKEIFKNIVDMDIRYMSGVTGKIELDEDYIGFALAKYKGNPDVTGFLSLLLEAVKYRNISSNIDKFYDDCGISGGSKKKVSLNTVQAASRIYFKNGFDLDEGILKCLYGKEKNFKFESFDDVIYNTALEELGLSEVISEEGLFVKGLTREEEIKYSHLILNGLVALDGEYSKKLVSWLKKNKWAGDNKFSSQNEGLYNWILYIKSNDAIEEQSKLLNSLIDSGKEIVGMKSNGYYVLDDSEYMKIPVGVFAIMSDYDNDTVLPEINRLEGYTGEGYSVAFLNKYDISYVGCPIELFIKDNKKVLFMDKEQTDMKDSESWFSEVGASISFNEEFDMTGFEEPTVEGGLGRAIINAERGILVSDFKCSDYLNITDTMKKEVTNILTMF